MLNLMQLIDAIADRGRKPGSVKYFQDKGDETFEQLLSRHRDVARDSDPEKDFKPIPSLKDYRPTKK